MQVGFEHGLPELGRFGLVWVLAVVEAEIGEFFFREVGGTCQSLFLLFHEVFQASPFLLFRQVGGPSPLLVRWVGLGLPILVVWEPETGFPHLLVLPDLIGCFGMMMQKRQVVVPLFSRVASFAPPCSRSSLFGRHRSDSSWQRRIESCSYVC